MNTTKYKYLWAAIYSFFLMAFTVYVILDSFVIARVYIAPPDNAEIDTGVNTETKTDTGTNTETKTDNSINTETKTDIETKTDNNVNTETKNDIEVSTETKTDDSDNTETKKDIEVSTETKTNTTVSTETKPEIIIDDSTYKDDKISIKIVNYREHETDIYVADVTVSSPEYLKTALAQNTYGKNIIEKTSETAENNNAILAVNGDYYGAQENGYVIKNGILYRSKAVKNREDLVIWQDGSFEIIKEDEITADELMDKGARQVLSFGPALVDNGDITVDQNDEVGRAGTSNPRTAIGVVDNLHYLFVVSDGRTEESEGLSLYQLAEFLQGLGAKTAYNLDGGGSSTFCFNGAVLNVPTTDGKTIKQRRVSDIVYIGY